MSGNILDREHVANWGDSGGQSSSIRERESMFSAFSGRAQKRVADSSVDIADRSKQQGASGVSSPAQYNVDHLVEITTEIETENIHSKESSEQLYIELSEHLPKCEVLFLM